MPRLMVTVIILFLATTGYAAQKAVTDTGEDVILHSDGTWVFAENSAKKEKAIDTNKTKFKKPESSEFLLKSKNNDSAFWMDTDKWSFKKATGNTDAEYELQLKGNDLYGMVITEAIHMPVESLADVAFTNAKSVAPDVEVTEKEYRYVNGNKVIYMRMSGTIQGMKITYLGYYYSDDSGSTQFLTYTGSNLVGKYKTEITDFLNGLSLK